LTPATNQQLVLIKGLKNPRVFVRGMEGKGKGTGLQTPQKPLPLRRGLGVQV